MSPTSAQLALAAGALKIAATFGQGGAVWRVSRAARGLAVGPFQPIGIWRGHAKRSRATVASSAPAQPVALEYWEAIGPLAAIELEAEGDPAPNPPNLQPGDILASLEAPTLRFRVKAPQSVVGYARLYLEVMP